jgi:hypothetical protein
VYWTIRSLPELETFTASERRILIAHAIPWRTRIWLFLRPIALGLAAVIVAIPTLYLLRLDLAAQYAAFPVWLGAAALVYLLQVRSLHRQLRDQIRNMLKGQRSPICLSCAYDLRGANTDVCPECGRSIILATDDAAQPLASADGPQPRSFR